MVKSKSISSLFKTNFENPDVDPSRVLWIKLGSTIPSAKRLWMIFFFGEDENQKECLVETWFYSSRVDRKNELDHLKEEFPHLTIA